MDECNGTIAYVHFFHYLSHSGMRFQYVILTKDHITHIIGHITHIIGHITHITSPVTGHVTHITCHWSRHSHYFSCRSHIMSPAVTCHCTLSSFTNIWYVYNKIHRQQIVSFGQRLANKVEVQYTLYKQSYSVHRPII